MIELSVTVTRALELLSAQGMSDKSLHAYTHTGFGCIVRNFQAKGLSSVTPTMLDEFLLEQFELFVQEKFSPWKWRYMIISTTLTQTLLCTIQHNSVAVPCVLFVLAGIVWAEEQEGCD